MSACLFAQGSRDAHAHQCAWWTDCLHGRDRHVSARARPAAHGARGPAGRHLRE